LVTEAQSTLDKGDSDRAGVLLSEAVALGVELPGAAALQKRIDKQKSRGSKKQPVSAPAAGPVVVQTTRRMSPAIWLGIVIGVIGVGLLVWLLLPKGARYEEQIAAATSSLEQKQFAQAVQTLQQIPSSSPL